jgi:hypothetical protein
MIKFELKKVKIFDEMSEETMCFTAQIWENGKHVADVSNRGYGGGSDVYPTKGFTHADVQKYTPIDVECEIFEKADEFDIIRRNQGKLLLIRKEGKIYQQKFSLPISKIKKRPDYKMWLTTQQNKCKKDGYEILNKNL